MVTDSETVDITYSLLINQVRCIFKTFCVAMFPRWEELQLFLLRTDNQPVASYELQTVMALAHWLDRAAIAELDSGSSGDGSLFTVLLADRYGQ